MTHPEVICLILGGGRGTRLWPLTKSRAKPAVPIGGKYRLVDIPLGNCLNSGIDRISVLTQFNSVSLHRHISQTYHFDFFHKGWVQILAAEQTTNISDWYQGTADAVRKQLAEIQATDAEEVLILAGDHLYRMDYSEIIQRHRAQRADVTVAVKPISQDDAARFGILRQEDDGRISAFVEKPRDADVLAAFLSQLDSQPVLLGSMGIYLFRADVLYELLSSTHDDFGSHVIPSAIHSHRVVGYPFTGYWEDIGTIRTFYESSLGLAQPEPPFSFHDPVRPVYTHPRFLPGCRIYDVQMDRVLLADGCVVDRAEIRNALIGNRSVIGRSVVIRDTVMMGADYYAEELQARRVDTPSIGVGPGAFIEGAILDKNVCIGAGVRIEPFPRGTDLDGDNWAVRDGIVVIPKDGVIPEGTVIAP
jgi:glucose-1-phosphate adenylyltransferase